MLSFILRRLVFTQWFIFLTNIFFVLQIQHVQGLQLNNRHIRSPVISLNNFLESDSNKETTAPNDFVFQNQFTNDFVSKNGGDYFVKSDVDKISFVCEASYPITWKFPYPDQLPVDAYYYIGSEETRTASFSSNISSPVNRVISNKMQIRLRKFTFFSLNVTCSSVEENPKLTSSIHLFLEGKDYMENTMKTIDLQLSRDNASGSTFSIPCRVASPNITAVLEVQDDNFATNKRWININNVSTPKSFDRNSQPLFNYSPKIGFILEKQALSLAFHGKQLTKLYRCSTPFQHLTPENYYYVYFSITLINKTTSESLSVPDSTLFPFRNVTKGNAKLIIYEVTREFFDVTCCSGVNGTKPKLSGLTFKSSLSGRLAAHHLHSGRPLHPNNVYRGLYSQMTGDSDCEKSIIHLFDAMAHITCTGDTINVTGTFTQMFHSAKRNADTGRTHEENTTADKTLTYFRVPSLDATTTEKMAVFVGELLYTSNRRLSRDAVYFPANRVSTDDAKKEPRESWPYIREYPRTQFYAGEPLLFFCVGVNIFYAQGARISVTWKNGTQTWLPFPRKNSELETEPRLVQLKDREDMFEGDPGNTISVFAEPVKAELKMESVNCWMPVMESTEWDVISKQITVLPSKAPMFLEEEVETLYFDLGDEEFIITCTIVDGVPSPNHTLLWNEKPIDESKELIARTTRDFVDGVGNIAVTLKNLQNETSGTFKCIASNLNSTVTRTVHVFITAGSHTGIVILLTVVGLLLLTVVVLVFKCQRNKRKK